MKSFRCERSKDGDRGRRLVATEDIMEGQLVFVERPLIALQSIGNVLDGALVCSYCFAFCGSPQQSIRIAADPLSLPGITATTTSTPNTVSTSTGSDYDLIPCRHKCGHVYCSHDCQNDDWEWGGHKELCTGWIPDETKTNESSPDQTDDKWIESQHPLVKFKIHARETNEIFLLVATWLIRIVKNNVPYYDDDWDHTHPYTDFMMNPWWVVKTNELLLQSHENPGAFADATSLEKTLKQLCEESHYYLQQSLPETFRQSPWLTPLGMARLIGSLEQNCLGIRRKHPIQRIIMEDPDFRKEMHQQIVRCLERVGMIADEDELSQEDRNQENYQEDSVSMHSPPQQSKIVGDSEKTFVEEWDYSYKEIDAFLASLPAHEKVDGDDQWDQIFRPLDGTAHFTIATKMNHSCVPNTILLYKSRGWGRSHPLVAYCAALRDIRVGEELTICYIDSNQRYEKRQQALANYGFICNCEKCEKEKNSSEGEIDKYDVEYQQVRVDVFGRDSDDDGTEESSSPEESDENEQPGEIILSNMVERVDSILNKSAYGKIPIICLAAVSNFVVKVATSVLAEDNQQVCESLVNDLLGQCISAIQNRDFASCRIVGSDLELVLYKLLEDDRAWRVSSSRMSYWCAALTASIGYAHDGSFIVAMMYLDKALIFGVERRDLRDFFAYVETFSSSMAQGPCPLGFSCQLPDVRDPLYQSRLVDRCLSKPIEFPVMEVAYDGMQSQRLLFIDSHCDPLVWRELASNWVAIEKWRNLDALVRNHQHRLVPVEIGRMSCGMQEKVMPFRHFVEAYLARSAAHDCWSLTDAIAEINKPHIAYLAQHPLLDQIPALYDDVDRNPCRIQPIYVNMWMGTGGTRTPLHFDSYDNLLVQVVGAKYIRLYASKDTSKLYVSTDTAYGLQGNMSDVDCEMEDFDIHPLVKECSYQEVLLLPGDCLFIPARHWHYVRSGTTSISVNYWF